MDDPLYRFLSLVPGIRGSEVDVLECLKGQGMTVTKLRDTKYASLKYLKIPSDQLKRINAAAKVYDDPLHQFLASYSKLLPIEITEQRIALEKKGIKTVMDLKLCPGVHKLLDNLEMSEPDLEEISIPPVQFVWVDPNVNSEVNQGYFGQFLNYFSDKYEGMSIEVDHMELVEKILGNRNIYWFVLTNGGIADEHLDSLNKAKNVIEIAMFCSKERIESQTPKFRDKYPKLRNVHYKMQGIIDAQCAFLKSNPQNLLI